MADQLGKILGPLIPQALPTDSPSSESETASPSFPARKTLPVPSLASDRGWTAEQEQDYAYRHAQRGWLLGAAGVPSRYARHSWETWRGPREGRLLGWAGRPWAVVAYGPPGTGKTHLATAIFADLLCRNWTGRWYEVAEALEEVKAEFDDDVRDGRTMRRLRDSPLLLLDDLGAERPTDFAVDRIGHVLRYRYSRELPTIITTNHASLTDLDTLDPRLSSRLGGNEAIQVNFAEREDWRLR